MSYVVLARKWRPMQFGEVVSQNHVSTTLMNAIKNNRLATAYLFSGPRGVGKTTSARIFAKAINCDNGPTATPCNVCPSCTEITAGRSFDVFEIDGASNRGIDEVRNIRANLSHHNTTGKHKIYIIDEVHMLTNEAFNALLKTLEEPPPRVLFIFATTEAHKVPTTILSRCQRYDFRRIPLAEIVQQLRKICNQEKIKIDDESLYLIAKKADGSMRDSQSLLDQVVSFCGGEVKASDLADLLGLINLDLFFECSECIVNKDVSAGLMLSEKVFNLGCDLGEFLNGLTEHCRNILVLKSTGRKELLEGLEAYIPRYQDAAKFFSETDLLRLIKLCSETAYGIKRSPNPKTILEMLMIKMIKMEKSVNLDVLLTHIQNLKNSPGVGSSGGSSSSQLVKSYSPPKSKDGETDTPVTVVHDRPGNGAGAINGSGGGAVVVSGELAEASLHTVKEKWGAIIEGVKGSKIHLGSFLNEGYPTGIREGVLEISFGKENGFHINAITQNRQLIESIIQNKTGFKFRIQCKKNETEDFKQILAHHKPASTAEDPPAAEEAVLLTPVLQRVIEVFDGEIVR
ncbi:MAG TPA: DNA polymerase III subunit gamma/tau [bacterium]